MAYHGLEPSSSATTSIICLEPQNFAPIIGIGKGRQNLSEIVNSR